MEEVLPPQTESGAGFEPTRVRQFTVFLENKVVRLQTLVRALEQGPERSSRGRFTIRRLPRSSELICSDPDESAISSSRWLRLHEARGGRAPEETTKNRSSNTCAALLAAEINIHYAYPLLLRPRGRTGALVDDPTLAARLLIRKGFTLIGESDSKLSFRAVVSSSSRFPPSPDYRTTSAQTRRFLRRGLWDV